MLHSVGSNSGNVCLSLDPRVKSFVTAWVDPPVVFPSPTPAVCGRGQVTVTRRTDNWPLRSEMYRGRLGVMIGLEILSTEAEYKLKPVLHPVVLVR